MAKICDFLIFSAKISIDSFISLVDWFLNKNISVLAPFFSKALWVSHSQFVPGATRIVTFGVFVGFWDLSLLFGLCFGLNFLYSISSFGTKTLSNVFRYPSLS